MGGEICNSASITFYIPSVCTAYHYKFNIGDAPVDAKIAARCKILLLLGLVKLVMQGLSKIRTYKEEDIWD